MRRAGNQDMPLYEYQCESCRHLFEVIQKFSDLPIETCPECGGRVQKVPSAPAIQFKGSGWYVTDYGKRGGAGNSVRDRDKKSDTPVATSSGQGGSDKAGSSESQASKSDSSPAKSGDSPAKTTEKA
jgi:putative FmdB family regulatory protein